MRSKEEMIQRLREIMDKIEAENPFDTFEPHEDEEGKHDVFDLHEARLHRLFIQTVLEGSDNELANFFFGEVVSELRKERQ